METTNEYEKIKLSLPLYLKANQKLNQCNDLKSKYNSNKSKIISISSIKCIEEEKFFLSKYNVFILGIGLMILEVALFYIILAIGMDYSSAFGSKIDSISENILQSMRIIKSPEVFIVVVFAALIFLFAINLFIATLYKLSAKRKTTKKARAVYDGKIAQAKKTNEKFSKICESINADYKQKSVELNAIIKKINTTDYCIIPQSYWIYAQDIYNLMCDNRADNLKEAINLLEDIQHKNRIENLTAQNNTDYTSWVQDDILRRQIKATEDIGVEVKKLTRGIWGVF